MHFWNGNSTATFHSGKQWQINGLVQDCSNSIANALELLQSCTKPWKCRMSNLRSQNTPHSSLFWVSYGLWFVSYMYIEKIQTLQDHFERASSGLLANQLVVPAVKVFLSCREWGTVICVNWVWMCLNKFMLYPRQLCCVNVDITTHFH